MLPKVFQTNSILSLETNQKIASQHDENPRRPSDVVDSRVDP